MASEMQCITTPSYSDPSAYQVSTLPRPVVSEATDVVIKVYAASINPIDVKKAAGILKLAMKDEYAEPRDDNVCHIPIHVVLGFHIKSALTAQAL
jgi:hypothetical protein